MVKAISVLLVAAASVLVLMLAVTSTHSAAVEEPSVAKSQAKYFFSQLGKPTNGEAQECSPRGTPFCSGEGPKCCTGWCLTYVYMGGLISYCERPGCLLQGVPCVTNNSCCLGLTCQKKSANALLGRCGEE